jgi:hypothetical protein
MRSATTRSPLPSRQPLLCLSAVTAVGFFRDRPSRNAASAATFDLRLCGWPNASQASTKSAGMTASRFPFARDARACVLRPETPARDEAEEHGERVGARPLTSGVAVADAADPPVLSIVQWGSGVDPLSPDSACSHGLTVNWWQELTSTTSWVTESITRNWMSNRVPSGTVARSQNRCARPNPSSFVSIAWGSRPRPRVSQFVPVQVSSTVVSVARWRE